jgi:hypothetical protein
MMQQPAMDLKAFVITGKWACRGPVLHWVTWVCSGLGRVPWAAFMHQGAWCANAEGVLAIPLQLATCMTVHLLMHVHVQISSTDVVGRSQSQQRRYATCSPLNPGRVDYVYL